MYSYFWHHQNPFSNSHSSPYHLENMKFDNVDQGMAWSKAMLFGDTETATKIAKEHSLPEIRALEASLCNYSQSVWEEERGSLLYKHCKAKFTQHIRLYRELLGTYPDILVNADVHDDVMGIGISEREASDGVAWKGDNLLGSTLTKIRDDLMDIGAHQ